MKKRIVVVVTLLLLSLSATAYATKWTDNPKETVGGGHISNAYYIPDTDYARVYGVCDLSPWYYVEAPADGS